MTTEWRCKNCKHYLDWLCICPAWNLQPGMPHESEAMGDRVVIVGDFRCGPDFGCVHFAPQQSHEPAYDATTDEIIQSEA